MAKRPIKSDTGRIRRVGFNVTEAQHAKLIDLAYQRNMTIKDLMLELVAKL